MGQTPIDELTEHPITKPSQSDAGKPAVHPHPLESRIASPSPKANPPSMSTPPIASTDKENSLRPFLSAQQKQTHPSANLPGNAPSPTVRTLSRRHPERGRRNTTATTSPPKKANRLAPLTPPHRSAQNALPAPPPTPFRPHASAPIRSTFPSPRRLRGNLPSLQMATHSSQTCQPIPPQATHLLPPQIPTFRYGDAPTIYPIPPTTHIRRTSTNSRKPFDKPPSKLPRKR